MRFYQTHQFDMLQNVANVLKKNKDALAAKVPALHDIITDFVERQDALYKLEINRINTVKLSSLQKKSIRDGLTDAVLKLLGVLRVHQFQNKTKIRPDKSSSGNASDSSYIHFTITNLNRATADNLCKVSQQVINAVKKIKGLHRYGVTADDIKDAEAYYKEFADNKEGPKLRKKETASRNEQITVGIKECISILENTIDPLMRIAAEDDQELNHNYKALRKVLPRGQGRPSDQETSYRKSRERK